jgi:hypothetical protein
LNPWSMVVSRIDMPTMSSIRSLVSCMSVGHGCGFVSIDGDYLVERVVLRLNQRIGDGGPTGYFISRLVCHGCTPPKSIVISSVINLDRYVAQGRVAK